MAWRLTRGREYRLPDSFTRVTGLIFHCRRGNANFFFLPFMRGRARPTFHCQTVWRPSTLTAPRARAAIVAG